ncbi:MAG: hypothetical protein WD557_16860 [Dehalococcoidia bacterium]
MAQRSTALRERPANLGVAPVPGVPGHEHTPEHTRVAAEHAGSHLQHAEKSSRAAAPFCAATTAQGRPCRARPQLGTRVCIYHDPGFASQRHEHARQGGIASGEARRTPRPLLEARAAALSDPLSVQVLLDAMVRLELLGKMTDARGKRLARLLSLAVRNVGRDGHDSTAYGVRRKSVDAELSGLVRQYEEEDRVRHVESIVAVGERRREFLIAGGRAGG